jgi:hypothetical protein
VVAGDRWADPNGAELVTARLDALKIGLSIGVGSGGVIALYLAWRRQHSTEADLDNRERALAHQQEVAASTWPSRTGSPGPPSMMLPSGG